MKPDARGPLADSPWFWLLLFAVMGLVVLEVAAPKYGRRQAQLERQYQARRPAQATPDSQTDEQPDEKKFSTPDDTIIPLWPIRLIVLALVVASAVTLLFGRRTETKP